MSLELFETEVVLLADTGKALCFRRPGSNFAHWIPRSQVHTFTLSTTGYDRMVMKAWFAKKLGFL
jgi:hypothetical protein